ncbi:MAG TPA: flagellar biosynthesis protein FlhF [Phycisphaerales bacterium]|nr:flagellar biosynthesis protein FlhF [Phycisphaerales bacterium]
MATTTLKTFHGESMAAALAEVKKDLGADAVILHTRAYKVGGVLGVGTRNMVEITASAETPALRPRPIRPRAASVPAPRPATIPAPTTGIPFSEARSASERAAPGEGFIPTPPWFQKRDEAPAPVGRLARPESRIPEAVGAQTAPAPAASPEPSGPAPGEPARTQPGASEQDGVGATVLSRLSAGRVAPAPTTPRAQAALEEELAAIRRLVGQVLQSSRRVEARSVRSGAMATAEQPGPSTGPLFDLYLKLLESHVCPEVADELSSAVRDELSPPELADAAHVREALLRHIAKRIPTAPPGPPPARAQAARPATIALIGPTGVGKTTTVAKLAANFKLRYGRRVGLVTADTYRIAAVEQLRTYADIVGLQLKVVLSAQDMAGALDSLSGCDVVLVDTAGRSQHDAARLDELGELLEAAKPDACHLVLSLGAAESVIGAAAERFGQLRPSHLLLTKLDEAVDFGVIANIAHRVKLPLSYVTTGQEVPDHIEPANADRLARLVLGGRAGVSAPQRGPG